jgi:DNA polymerase I-like protein with 3'-5' exonuclease and polymerase domains
MDKGNYLTGPMGNPDFRRWSEEVFGSSRDAGTEKIGGEMSGDRRLYIDTETTGLRWMDGDRPFLIGWALDDGPINILDLRESAPTDGMLAQYLLANGIVKVFHNATFDLHMLKAVGLNWGGQVIDTMHLAHLAGHEYVDLEGLSKKLLPHEDGWKDVVKDWLKKERGRRSRLRKKGENLPDPNYSDVPDHIMKPYLVRDVRNTRDLYKCLWQRVYGISKRQIKIESALIPLVVRMEEVGMRIDMEYTKQTREENAKEVSHAVEQLRERFGEGFSITNNNHLRKAFFEELGLAPLAYTPKTRVPTINNKVYEEYAEDKYVDLVARASKISGFNTKYYVKLLDSAVDEIVHCGMKQNGAITGRFSIEKPPLQQIPNNDEKSKQAVRRCFIPRDGHILIMSDYDQMEFRLLAHYAASDKMLEMYAKGLDLHGETAKMMSCIRRKSKEINFGKLYGMGVKKLAVRLGVPEEEAQDLVYRWNDTYPDAISLMRSITKEVKAMGFVQDIYGKRYYVEEDKAYKGLNYLIQGTGAQILKRALIAVDGALRNEFGPKCYPVNTVHDEIIFECDKELWDQRRSDVVEVIEDCMTEDSMFALTLPVDVSYSETSWADKKGVTLATN